jgi:hypothetical protein
VSQRFAIDPAAAALLIVHAASRSGGAALLVRGWAALSGISLLRRERAGTGAG